VAPRTPPFAQVLAEVQKIHGEAGLRNASLGFALIPVAAKSPDALTGYHPDLALLPASTLKVVTTATALELLGSDFRFETVLQHTGVIEADGTLKGDVIIKGGGDPTLGASEISQSFLKWQGVLKNAGIQKVEGRIIGDASLFGTQLRPDSWQWNDLGNYYAAGACGLTFHRNHFSCHFITGEVGTVAQLTGTKPKLPGVTFVNEMMIGEVGSGDQGYLYAAPYSTLVYLHGTLPAGGKRFTIRGALPDPAYFCARAFSHHLEKGGLEVIGEPTTIRHLQIGRKSLGTRHLLSTQYSAPLAQLIVTSNMRSNNLHAESLHRILGAKKGEGGTTSAASKVVTAHRQGKKIDLTGFQMTDGCALSRTNSITARQMTLMLYHLANSPHFETFYQSLPIAGRPGTLRKIAQGANCEGLAHAKSGSIERVKTSCGYLGTISGERYAFTLLINNFTGEVSSVKAKIVRIWNKMVAL
jgi:D-alanyl-D-alanine carboxypeptidase/D-alanyl-D-alanine-endopeptidase (penicillin-binding protein 4)